MSDDDRFRLFHLPFSFMLPQRVASERGYFADEGLDADLVERERSDVEWKYIPAEERLTDDYGVDVYPVCKWESLKRTWEMDDGRVVAKGTFADQPYSVFTRRDDVEEPADLAGLPVGINERTGQEYTAMRALEEHVAPEDVELVHHGMPTDRLRALYDGDVDAVTLLEPHSTLAERLGFERVLTFENHMGIVGDDDLDRETFAAFMRAYGRAVGEINAHPDRYREEYLSMLRAEESLAPDLFAEVDLDAVREELTVPEYSVPQLATGEELDEHLRWMQRRELVDDAADISGIVADGGD
ncbi:ABC transporter substrate-binding protein [Halolamina salifodinae]|uniref:NitT/TauT family transport system substrate-binding protein n=1 Tax=Halolamina salifodinae TaxID=1202767 RepID=A0A8T4GSS2_9EURY|nr:ABC transporter substrate-binding protein [Halolamina salifodinae]MBP1986141.1 NitT/TauT family transport system substrate-binding protein [Halolamina salifodinae]